MRMVFPCVCLLPCLAGCGYGSGIVAVGPGIYAVSEERAPVLGGGREANRAVLAEASGFCLRQGRVSAILDLRPDGDPFTPYYPTAFDAMFRCLTTAEAAAGGLPQAQAQGLDQRKP